jgi:dihydrofolate reductase
MTRFVYATSTTLDGHLADENDSLEWLFTVEGGDEALKEIEEFNAGVAVMVEGSTTYEWVIEHEQLMDFPEKWQNFYGDRKTFVFTSRSDLPRVPGADVEFVSGEVPAHEAAIREAAGEKDVWLVGGGELVGEFAEAGMLDEIWLSVAPVTLGSGAPLLPRRFESDRLELKEVGRAGQFVQLKYLFRK